MPYSQGKSPLPDGPLEFDAAFVWPYSGDIWIERLLEEKMIMLSASKNWVARGVPQIGFHGVAVEELAFEHLASLGRELIVYIGVDTSNSVLSVRRERFFDRALERGFEVISHEIHPTEGVDSVHRVMKVDEFGEELRRFLAELPKPASIWCDDDYVARAICANAAMEGLKIPDDLAVLGLGDYSVSRSGSPLISTIPQPGQLIGRQAIGLLRDALVVKSVIESVVHVSPPPVIDRESTTGGGRAENAYRRIYQEISDRACDGLSVAELAGKLNVSQVTFSKRFGELFGCTPGEEIRRVKTEFAKRHLINTDDSVEQTALLCGFEDSGNFSKFFKRQTGQTASQYRKEKSISRGGGE